MTPEQFRDARKVRLINAHETVRDWERERLAVMLDWMWGTVLPKLQPIADHGGFGGEWSGMIKERGLKEARAASRAALTAERAAEDDSFAAACYAAYAAAADTCCAAAADAVDYDTAVDYATAADAVDFGAAAAADAVKFWGSVDPAGITERMTSLKEGASHDT